MNMLSTLLVISGKFKPYPVEVMMVLSYPISSLKSPVLKSNWYPFSRVIRTRNKEDTKAIFMPVLE